MLLSNDPKAIRWHDLSSVLDADALLLFAWLRFVGAGPTGLFFATPDLLARELVISRERAIAAVAKLAGQDEAQTLGDRPALLVYDAGHQLGYVHGWNVPRADTAPHNAAVVASRLDFLATLPPCGPVDAMRAELKKHDCRFVPAASAA